jgi:hypothetical protein
MRKYIERNVIPLPEVIWMVLMSWSCIWRVCLLCEYFFLYWHFLNPSSLLRPRTPLVIHVHALIYSQGWREGDVFSELVDMYSVHLFPEGVKYSFQVLIDVRWFCVNAFSIVFYLSDYCPKRSVWKSVSPEFQSLKPLTCCIKFGIMISILNVIGNLILFLVSTSFIVNIYNAFSEGLFIVQT